MGEPRKVEPMLITCTFRVTGFLFTYGSPALSGAFVPLVLSKNLWVTLHLCVRHLTCSLTLYVLFRESLFDSVLIGVQFFLQTMFILSKCRIALLHYMCGCATLSAAYVGYLYLENHWIKLKFSGAPP